MGLNLNLFVHGVPKGQKIWGPQEDDRIYIESIYGRKTNVEVQLLVDIIQFKGNVNCYYTYYRSGNILDNDGRAGSYFALTVRSSEYYTDLVNIYNILDAAYHKFVLGTIIKSDGSVTKFITQDFDQVDKQLQDVEKEIIHYLSSFSIGSDVIGLNGFMANAKLEAVNVNLLECNSKNLLTHVKKNGNVSVSPLYPTTQVAELTKRKNEEIESIKSQLQRQISMVQNEAAQKINEASEGKQKSIEAIKREFASADNTIADLKKQLETEKSSISTLTSELKKHKEELKNYESTKHELDSKKQELDNANRILSSIKQSFSVWNEVNTIQGTPQTNANKPKKTVLEKLNKFHPMVDFIGMLLLMLFIAYGLLKSPSSNQPSSEELKDVKELIKELNKNLKETENQLTKQSNENTGSSDFLDPSEIIAKYPKAKIDIKELSTTNPNMKKGVKYHISIKEATGGSWKSNDFTIVDEGIVIPNKVGICEVSYVIDNVSIVSRKINVIE
jgi:hypothetical protein